MRMYITKQRREHVNTLVEFMKGKNLSPNAVAAWGSITPDGHLFACTNTACHAGLNGWYNHQERRKDVAWNADGDSYLFANRIQHGNNSRPLPRDLMVRFFNWIANDSPYKDAFFYKDGEEIVEMGYSILQPKDIPCNLFASAMFATRAITEHHGSIGLIWDELVKRGVDPNVAFCYAHTLKTNDHKNIILQGHSWHSSLSEEYITPNLVLNFCKGVMPKALNYEWGSDKGYRYSPIHTLFYYRNYDDPIKSMYNHWKFESRKVLKVEVKNNPFPKTAQQVDQREMVPIDNFLDLMAEGINKYYKDKL